MSESFIVDLPLLQTISNLPAKDTDKTFQNETQYENYTIRKAFETVLLKQTLEYLKNKVPYYRAVMSQIGFNPSDFRDLSDLKRFPLLSRADLIKHRTELLAEDCNIVSIRSTSGTTSQSIPVFFSDKDLECEAAWRKIMSKGSDYEASSDILLDVKPAVQRLVGKSNWKGLTLSAIYNIDGPPLFRMDVSYEDFIIQQLFDYFPIPGKTGFVTVLRCMPPFLLPMLTKAMLDRGITPKETHVRNIFLAGGHSTEGIQQLVAKHWNAELHTSFSCSELNGFARNCVIHKNKYHFDPTVFVEVLDVSNHTHVEKGEDGMLVLTSLYPFQQAQPFLRYILGDMVRYHGYECECGNTGFSIEFRGRLNHCLDISHLFNDSNTRRYLGTAEIEDALSLFHEVPSAFYPRFRISEDKTKVDVDVEITWRVNSTWETELKKRIKNHIRKNLEVLYGEIPFPLSINLYDKGQLKNYCRLYPTR